jgi:hypothetical protein
MWQPCALFSTHLVFLHHGVDCDQDGFEVLKVRGAASLHHQQRAQPSRAYLWFSLINDHRKLAADKATSTNAESGKRQRHALCLAIDVTNVSKGFV